MFFTQMIDYSLDNSMYKHPLWLNKRSEILERDDYTCQDCGTFSLKFNNMKHIVHDSNHQVYLFENNVVNEVHTYDFWDGYNFQLGNVNFTIHLNKASCYIVFPTLQVHHLKYINNRKPWEYENDDLVTLCKNCHEIRHLKEQIPIYDEELINKPLFLNYLTQDEGELDVSFSSFEPWTLLKKENNQYKLFDNFHNLHLTILYKGQMNENSKNEIQQVISYFIDKYLLKHDVKIPWYL